MIAGFTELSIAFVFRMILSVFYVISGSLKIFNITGFERELEHYRVFPPLMRELIAYFLPPLEIIVGILLFTKSYVIILLAIVIILELLMTIFTTVALKDRGKMKNCAIFGTVNVKLSWLIVALNVLLLASAVYVLVNTILLT